MVFIKNQEAASADVATGKSKTLEQAKAKIAAASNAPSYTAFQLADAQLRVAAVAAAGAVTPMDVHEIELALQPLVGVDHACLLASWIGGGPQYANQSFADVRASAESDCGTKGLFGFFGTSVQDARDHLEVIDPQMEKLVAKIGSTREKAGTSLLDQQSQEDADKIIEEVKKKAAIVGGGIGTVAIVALAIYGWILFGKK